MSEAVLANVRQLRALPALRQLALLVGIAAAVAAGLWAFTWSQQPQQVPLYAQLADKDAAELSEALRAANIPFAIDPRSGALTVASEQVHEARLKLAAQGLPRGSAQGFEMMQQEQGFGTSQFIETARYQHALETELSRSIASLQPVRGARVHLALPKTSAFARNRDPASASVLVELHPGRRLEQNQVASIVHMVASSVPNLLASQVTVVDQYGQLLTGQNDGAEVGQTREQFEYARRVEADYVRRIEQLLSPMLGPGKLSAQVNADLDFSITEEARETYTPDRAAVRSEQTAEAVSRSPTEAQGVPGATSNQPPPQTATPPLNELAGETESATPLSETRQATRNFELDKTVSHTRQPTGRIRRLSVAVLVDHIDRPGAKNAPTAVALSREELAKVEALVREAVGFDARRGDSLSVQNAPFLKPEPVAPESIPLWERRELQGYARQGLGALLVLVLIFAVLRPVLRALLPRPVIVPAPALAGASPGAAALVQDVADDRVSLGSGSDANTAADPYQDRLRQARAAVSQDPKRVAQVMKNWMGQD